VKRLRIGIDNDQVKGSGNTSMLRVKRMFA